MEFYLFRIASVRVIYNDIVVLSDYHTVMRNN